MCLGRKVRYAIVLPLLLAASLIFAQRSPSNIVFLHGHIITVDPNDSIAQAIAVRGDSIVKVGTDAEVQEFASKTGGFRIIDLQDRTVTPGLIDTHAHIAEGGVE